MTLTPSNSHLIISGYFNQKKTSVIKRCIVRSKYQPLGTIFWNCIFFNNSRENDAITKKTGMGIWDDSVLIALTFQPKKPFVNWIYQAVKETLFSGDIFPNSNLFFTKDAKMLSICISYVRRILFTPYHLGSIDSIRPYNTPGAGVGSRWKSFISCLPYINR